MTVVSIGLFNIVHTLMVYIYLSLTPDRAISGHPAHCRVSFDVHTTRMVTGALPLQGRGSGTLYWLNCNNVYLSQTI